MDNPMLVFTGGDPLMRPDVFDIADYAVKKGVRVSITPSATPNVTKQAMRKAKNVGLSRWAFSIDGHCAEVHDHFREIGRESGRERINISMRSEEEREECMQ